ncbi:MAG: DsbC family protein [Deltaproteobacteria bacterium]|nr:DsbC family protein [Deltaproteobacteria bacterium]
MFKRLAGVFVFTFFLALSSVPSFAFDEGGKICGVLGGGCSSECMECHTLTKEEAGKILKVESMGATVDEVKMSPVKGLWQIGFEQGGKKGAVYLSFDKEYFFQAQFIPVSAIGEAPELRKIDVSSIPLGDAIVMGDKNAKHKIIVFDDPECPYCVRLHAELKKVVAKRKDIAFYLKMFPLPFHPTAFDKSKTIVCENSMQLLEDAYAGKKIPAPKCDTKAIEENIALAKKLGISGTPAIIFPDGRHQPGALGADDIINMLDNPPVK